MKKARKLKKIDDRAMTFVGDVKNTELYLWYSNLTKPQKANMSYGATVGASAANSNLIKIKTKYLALSWINPMYTATFQSC